MHYLYRHIRLDTNEVFYVGIGTMINKVQLNYTRANCNKKRNKFWKRIVAKTDYEIEIMLESDDYEFIKQKEIEFIALYGRRNLGKGTLVNLTDGGEGSTGLIVSEETRVKKRNICISLGLRPPIVFGRRNSPESIKRTADAIRGVPRLDMRGSNNILATPVVQICKDTNDVLYAFGHIGEAEDKTKVSRTLILSSIKDKKNDGGGYHWEYISKEDYKKFDFNDKSPEQRTVPLYKAVKDDEIYYGNSLKELGNLIGVTSGNISHCILGNRKKSKGYSFEYLGRVIK